MNWTRTVLDGFAMAAYFNLFAGLVALYKPRLMFPGYPPAIIKAAKDPPTSAENRFYWIWICFGELLPLLLYGAVSTMEGLALDLFWGAAAPSALWRGQYHGGRDNRVLASGPDRVYPVDDGQFL